MHWTEVDIPSRQEPAIDAAAMSAAADKASDLLKSLANRNRLLILCQLVGGERSVGELAGFLGIRDSTVSQHLALLRKDGLVETRRDAQTIWYSIASEPARRVLEVLYRFFCPPEISCGAAAAALTEINVAGDGQSHTSSEMPMEVQP